MDLVNRAVALWITTGAGAVPTALNSLRKVFPTQAQSSNFDLSTLAGPFFLVLMLHMLFPIFLSTIVHEKEKKLVAMMKMMGLRMPAWYLVNYLFFLALYLLALVFTMVGGYATRLRILTVNSPLTVFLLLFLFGNAMIAMAFFFACFFQSSRTSTVVGYFYVIGQALVGIYLVQNLVQNLSTPQGPSLLFRLRCGAFFNSRDARR
jgi:hypothetical protein